ncbi:MAG: glutathione peroxidase [Sulfitobacter sp.]|nr:glutathione peroxidase [Sulfitobacter sp.]
MRALAFAILTLIWGNTAMAANDDMTFANIDGGTLNLADWAGQPVLVVNTASQCGFTPQYSGLQELYDTYKDRGLVVLAVPSDDFNQELDDAEAVKDFCEITFGLDLPMTDITPVRGPDAHPFYRAVKDQTGFTPRWNFNKVLIGPDGKVVGTWGSTTRPTSRPIKRAIEGLLDQS